LIKEMLDWKHKYHALENEKQKLAIHTEGIVFNDIIYYVVIIRLLTNNAPENVKRLEQGFRLELAAAVEAHVSKIEEISDELQRLASENEAFRKQLAMNNIEPGRISSLSQMPHISSVLMPNFIVTTLLETGLDEHNGYTNDDIKFLKVGQR
jgi:hypothetical protein